MGSLGGEFKIGPSTEGAAITPTSVRVRQETVFGSKGIAPQRTGNVILFVQKSGQIVREFLYNWESDSYVAKDLTLLAENLFTPTIIDFGMQKDPLQRVWMVRSDGDMVCMAYQENSDFYAHSLITSPVGSFESVCVVPSADGTTEEVWVSMYTGEDRWILYFDDSLYVDGALTYEGLPVGTTVSGLSHLVGKTVSIIGDMALYPSQVVPLTGIVTIDPSATNIQVGLNYVSKVKTVRPEIPVGGTSQGVLKRWSEIRVRVLESYGLTVEGEV